MPKKLDNFSFDGIIKGVKKVGEGVKKYIDNWWDQYRNDEGNIQLFNATNSNTSNVKLDDKKSINRWISWSRSYDSSRLKERRER